MPRFFYSETNFQQHKPSDNIFRRFLKRKQRKKRELQLQSTSKLANPYSKHVGEKSSSRKFYKYILLILLLATWIGFVIYLPFFHINNIEFDGLKIIKQDEIQLVVNDYLNKRRWLPTKNFFLFRSKKLVRIINEAFSVESIYVTKIFPDKIKISINEKISTVITYINGKFYLLDEKGNVIKLLKVTDSILMLDDINTTTAVSLLENQTTTIKEFTPNLADIKNEFGSYPIIIDDSLSTDMNIGDNVFSKEVVDACINSFNMLSKQGVGEVEYYNIKHSQAGLEAHMDKTPRLIFLGIYSDMQNQIDNIKLILQKNHPTEYVDVRFGERVYWK